MTCFVNVFVGDRLGARQANSSPAVCRMAYSFGTGIPAVSQNVEVKVTEKNKCKTIPAKDGANLRTILKDNGVDIYTLGGKLRNCGGGGSCGTCIVAVTEGMYNCGPRTAREEKHLEGKPENFRLACRTTVHGEVSITTKPQ